MFVVFQLNKTVVVQVMGRYIEMPLSYAEGMVGAMPVFETRETAEAFAGEHLEHFKIEEFEVSAIKVEEESEQ